VLQEEVEEGMARFVYIIDCRREQYKYDPLSPNQMVQYAVQCTSIGFHSRAYNMLYPVGLITVLLLFHFLSDTVWVYHRPLGELLQHPNLFLEISWCHLCDRLG
jgi:hypothetical protein